MIMKRNVGFNVKLKSHREVTKTDQRVQLEGGGGEEKGMPTAARKAKSMTGTENVQGHPAVPFGEYLFGRPKMA